MKYQGFAWAGLYVENMEASIAFYRDVLGLRLTNNGGSWAHFDAGNGAMLELFTGGTARPAPKEPDKQPLILGLRVEDFDAAYAELTQKGVRFIGEIGQYNETRWAHFSDPEGNRLEIKGIPAASST
jgi:predicted enzyme related to lactoylglutathione lyase